MEQADTGSEGQRLAKGAAEVRPETQAGLVSRQVAAKWAVRPEVLRLELAATVAREARKHWGEWRQVAGLVAKLAPRPAAVSRGRRDR